MDAMHQLKLKTVINLVAKDTSGFGPFVACNNCLLYIIIMGCGLSKS